MMLSYNLLSTKFSYILFYANMYQKKNIKGDATMFNNVSGKIKSISKILCAFLLVTVIIGTLVVAIGWEGLYVEDGGRLVNNKDHREHRYFYSSGTHNPANEIPPYIVLLYGAGVCFGIYFTSLLIYGFGQLIENSSCIEGKQKNIQKEVDGNNPTTLLKDYFSTYANDVSPDKQEKKPMEVTTGQSKEKSLDNSSEKNLFLEEVKSFDSMVEIWNIWRKYSLDIKYPSVNDYIRQVKDIEQLHGKTEDIQEKKDRIKEMLQ